MPKYGFWNSILRIFKNILTYFKGIFFREKRANEYKLIEAVEKQNFSEIERLISLGVNVNLKDKSGETILMKAVDKNNYCIVKLLLGKDLDYEFLSKNRCGANTEIKDKNGETALMHAIRNCYVDMVGILIDSGANVLAKNKDNKTVQDIVVECDDKVIKRFEKKYKYVFSQIREYNKNKDNISVLNDMLEEKDIYEDKIKDLEKEIKNKELGSDELASLKNEQKKYEEILRVLNSAKDRGNVFDELKKIEDYEEIKELIDNSFMLKQEDYTKYIKLNKLPLKLRGKTLFRKNKKLNSTKKNDIPNESFTEELFNYDFKNSQDNKKDDLKI